MDEYNPYYAGLEEKIYPPQRALPEHVYPQEQPSISPHAQYQQQQSYMYTDAYQSPQSLPMPVYAPVYVVPPLYLVMVPPPDRHKGVAITGFVLGLISLISGFLPCGMGVIVPCVGITFSALGLRSTQHQGLAITGLILSILGLLLTSIYFIFLILILMR